MFSCFVSVEKNHTVFILLLLAGTWCQGHIGVALSNANGTSKIYTVLPLYKDLEGTNHFCLLYQVVLIWSILKTIIYCKKGYFIFIIKIIIILIILIQLIHTIPNIEYL